MLQTQIRRVTVDDLEKDRAKEDEVREVIDLALGLDEPKAEPARSWQHVIVKSSASLISIAASYMSLYYTLSWFLGRLPFFQALCMTVIIVGAILLIPQMIKMALDRKGWKPKVASSGLAFALLIAASFSMMTTIGTLYNNQSVSSIESSRNAKVDRDLAARIKARQDQRSRLERAIAMAESDELRYTARIDVLLSEGVVTGPVMSSLVANRNKAQVARRENEDAYSRLLKEEEGYSDQASTITAERPDFISWIAARFQADRDRVELWMNAIPAIFVDVLAPSMLMVVLFL